MVERSASASAGEKPRIDRVLFDIDGTLVASNDAHARAWVDAYAAFDVAVPFDTVRPLIGMGGDKLLAAIGAGIEPDTQAGKALLQKRKTIFMERYLPDVRALPGARDLVDLLRERALTLVVVSAASSEELQPLLAIAGVSDCFDHIVHPGDVAAGKPDPDIVHSALGWRNGAPDRAVMIGDTRFDIEAAHAADVRCIALRCGGSLEKDLAEADAIFNAPLDVAGALHGSSLDELVPGLRQAAVSTARI